MTHQEFIAKWRDNTFGEKQASQEMFIDICHLVGHPTPGELGNKDVFTFEKTVPTGTPDAYLQGHFGWEFKGSDAQLDGALLQLLRYQVYLQTPPLLIVSSFKTIRIRTNFPGMETVLHEIPVADLDQPDYLVKLKNVFFDPNQFRPNRSLEDVTRETADIFGKIVADMEARGHDPGILARYLNQIIFCLYAEDAGLLPGNLFTRIVGQHFKDPVLFNQAVTGLFTQMASGGLFGADEIPYFNGDLFNDVDPVELSSTALFLLEQASKKNWRNIEPSIFGTLFERALDASQRSQLGAHYTSASDIMLVVDPVVMEALRREWDAVRQDVSNLLAEEDRNTSYVRLRAFQQRLFEVHVLDPACGSGNFLYLALRSLLDFEKTVIDFAAEHGWFNFTPTVKPDQMLGLEISPYAVALARTSLWIGYIQWHQANGFPYTQSPILTPLVTIQQTDSIMDLSAPDNPREPEWPQAEFIIGNPPFLGGKLLRSQLGDPYVNSLFALYDGRVPAEADLVCYWFEKSRAMLAEANAWRVGLLGTQGIRGGANRRVLQSIKQTGDIFLAWSDQPWILAGAAVHVSIVGFDEGSESHRLLDGNPAASINANLTAGTDLTRAVRLKDNIGIAFMGDTKGGAFDIPGSVAQQMLDNPNPHGEPNSDVIKPWINGRDITQRNRGMWIIDFGYRSIEQSTLYEAPFEYVNLHVRPSRQKSKRQAYADNWWIHMEPRPGMRQALQSLDRYIATPRVSKHRLFSWVQGDVISDSALIAIARDDDYTFGVLHSHSHELWSRAMGTQVREAESGFRYTPRPASKPSPSLNPLPSNAKPSPPLPLT